MKIPIPLIPLKARVRNAKNLPESRLCGNDVNGGFRTSCGAVNDKSYRSEVSGVILAGGKNARMGGTNKAFLAIDGERLIDRVVRLFNSLFSETILVTNEPLEYLDQDVMIVTDIYPGKGSLGGIYTGLFFASGSHIFVAACDMPFLKKSFIEYMIGRIDRYDIAVPVQKEGYQPLHAIYSKACLSPMRKLIQEDRLKVTGFYKGRRVLTIGEEITRQHDPERKIFFNINSPEDLAMISSA